jgi:8-oxo-dGTP pyrophosphatase MutT (NUDIX family)
VSAIADALRGALAPVRPDPAIAGGTPAAVLVPVLDLPEPALLFTVRSQEVRDHKGEISFPGGVRHPEDRDLLGTALRETEEELGILSQAVEVLGALPPTPTVVTGYVIVPFVGLLTGRPALAPSPVEIAEVLELPVAMLSAVEREEGALREDGFRTWFAYEVDGNTVWGATGRIVHGLLEVLRGEGWDGAKEG